MDDKKLYAAVRYIDKNKTNHIKYVDARNIEGFTSTEKFDYKTCHFVTKLIDNIEIQVPAQVYMISDNLEELQNHETRMRPIKIRYSDAVEECHKAIMINNEDDCTTKSSPLIDKRLQKKSSFEDKVQKNKVKAVESENNQKIVNEHLKKVVAHDLDYKDTTESSTVTDEKLQIAYLKLEIERLKSQFQDEMQAKDEYIKNLSFNNDRTTQSECTKITSASTHLTSVRRELFKEDSTALDEGTLQVQNSNADAEGFNNETQESVEIENKDSKSSSGKNREHKKKKRNKNAHLASKPSCSETVKNDSDSDSPQQKRLKLINENSTSLSHISDDDKKKSKRNKKKKFFRKSDDEYDSYDFPKSTHKDFTQWFNKTENGKTVKMFHLKYGVSILYENWNKLKCTDNYKQYLRTLARSIWKEYHLKNRAIDLSKCKNYRLKNRSPRKELSPIKKAVCREVYFQQIDMNVANKKMRKMFKNNWKSCLGTYINSLIQKEQKNEKQGKIKNETDSSDSKLDSSSSDDSSASDE